MEKGGRRSRHVSLTGSGVERAKVLPACECVNAPDEVVSHRRRSNGCSRAVRRCSPWLWATVLSSSTKQATCRKAPCSPPRCFTGEMPRRTAGCSDDALSRWNCWIAPARSMPVYDLQAWQTEDLLGIIGVTSTSMPLHHANPTCACLTSSVTQPHACLDWRPPSRKPTCA